MLKAAIVGATGIVGQQFVLALQDHPWFKIEGLAASQRSAGQSYSDALRDPESGAMRWYVNTPPNPDILDLPVEVADDLDPTRFDVIFTGVESGPAKVLEPLYAKHCPVISTASAFRYEDDIPVLIPAVNDDHIGFISQQQKQRGWKGFITPQPNCTTVGLAITLAPLVPQFGIETVAMTSMQAISGSGRNGGVLSLDIIDNVIPYIPGEEEKIQKEVRKVLGRYTPAGLEPADIRISATCTRVPVIDGHTESVLVITKQKAELADVRAAFEQFGQEFANLGLPSSPNSFIVVRDDPFRPQPRLDRDADDGMATVVGRLRPDTAFEKGLQYVLISHNTKMGAAKGAVLTAEYLTQKGAINS